MTLTEASQLLSAWIERKPAEMAAQKAALDSYGQLFRPDNIVNVTKEDFKAFLQFKNNKHWAGIQRQPNIYAEMDRLKAALSVLVDESRPIQGRLDDITDKNGHLYIKGLGRAVLTPILMCVYQDKYAVYNRISEQALSRLGRNKLKVTDSLGKRYIALNEACHQISREINQPLRLVDAMFSLMVHGSSSPLNDSSNFEPQVEDEAAEATITPATSIAADVPAAFFSYSREDSEFALKLAQDLKTATAVVWLDQLDISPGQHWDRAVENALASCPNMLLILSPSAVESANVMDEVSFALDEHKLIIPVLHLTCKIPFRLRRLQYVDARKDYDKALKELLRLLGRKF